MNRSKGKWTYMKKIVLCAFWIISLQGMAVEVKPTITITKETLEEYRTTINPFIERKKQENQYLQWVPSSKTPLGWLTNKFIGSVISPLMGYGEVDMDHAKTFLERTFENESMLKTKIDQLEKDQDSIDYISAIVKKAESAFNKQDKVEFMKIVK